MTEDPIDLLIFDRSQGNEHRRKNSFAHAVGDVEEYCRAHHQSLAAHRQIADESTDPVVGLVMQIILDDQLRHAELVLRIIATMRDALNWTHSKNALPPSGGPRGSCDSDSIPAVRAALEQKREHARALRQLARRCNGLNAGLITELFETMATASDGHARLLQFVLKRLQSQRSAGRVRVQQTASRDGRYHASGIAIAASSDTHDQM